MNNLRKKEAWDKREEANLMANERPVAKHISNGDEQKFRNEDNKPAYPVSFTKGLPHDEDTGLIKDPQHFQYLVKGIDSGDPMDFRYTPLGPEAHCGPTNCSPPASWTSIIAQTGDNGNPVGLRAWESQSAGLIFELEGMDAQAVTMPPHPKLGSDELTAEMAEVYAQALLRDVPFNAMSAGILDQQYLDDKSQAIPQNGVANQPVLSKLETEDKNDVKKVLKVTEELKKLNWFSDKKLKLNAQEEARRCNRQFPTPSNAFRGITRGDDIGPYISQFLLMGSPGINANDGDERNVNEGKIAFGAISIDQRVRTAKPIDYMTKWEQWFDVQNAAKVSNKEEFEEGDAGRRFIYTPRDLATYVHYDALYEAYFNACLILLGKGVAFDPGIPYQENDSRDHQQGFAHFGGPHILTLVTEVATRALKAVRFQKYNVHRRCRPEVLAARITKADKLSNITNEFSKMRDDIGTTAGSILHEVDKSNEDLYENEDKPKSDKNYLLPMAFTEGSPMHPAYGAGHATVAGACVTVLKAFFDCNSIFKPDGEHSNQAYVSIKQGTELVLSDVFDQYGKEAHLTVEGELNKLASNISIGRDWAGVHYFTDYYESLLMGEQIAIAILEEQKLLFKETFSMSIPLFGGDTYRI